MESYSVGSVNWREKMLFDTVKDSVSSQKPQNGKYCRTFMNWQRANMEDVEILR